MSPIREHTVTEDVGLARNGCLAALSRPALALLEPQLSEVTLPLGAVLWNEDEPAQHVYFPLSGFVSILMPMRDGSAIEVGSAGQQAVAGSLLQVDPTEALTVGQVQIGGQFSRIATNRLLAAAAANEEIGRLVGFARDWILLQAQQLVACTALHTGDQRFCRWLWHCHQAMQASPLPLPLPLPLTQEQIAGLLGIRRTTVSFIAQAMHNAGAIDYRRGKISICDPERLKAAACECCRRLDETYWPSVRLASHRPLIRS
ncbi:MAG TPA: Crp/Fnr family transcriptional regulator [Pseudolabrys sp.]|nr:Crp/Fnr family transcriptional regulator [Pseudolabrys sp.]